MTNVPNQVGFRLLQRTERPALSHGFKKAIEISTEIKTNGTNVSFCHPVYFRRQFDNNEIASMISSSEPAAQ